jgi:antitoxin component YwqK of YwqJK toxin-antitoxin module
MVRCFFFLSALLLSAATADAVEFFQSNEIGMAISPISEAQIGGHEWVLTVMRREGAEIRTLTDRGVEITRWEDVYRDGRLVSETRFEKGMLSQVTDFRDGHPVRQVQYANGKESLVRDYFYSDNLLRSVSVFDAAGNLRYKDSYFEGPDGRLRRAVRETSDGKRTVTSLDTSDDRIVSEWLGSGGNGVFFRYSDGAIVSKEEWKGVDLQSEEKFLADPNGSATISQDHVTGRTTKKVFDTDGHVLSELVTDKGNVVRSVVSAYADGKLQSKITKTPGRREEVRFEYDAHGELVTSRTTENRQLVKVTHYTGKNSFFEDLYLDGRIVLRVFYEKGKKIKEVPASSAASVGTILRGARR